MRKVDFGRRVEARAFRADLEESWHVRRWRRLADEQALEGEWDANSYLTGHLDVYGRRRRVVRDTRLRDAVAPWLSAPGQSGSRRAQSQRAQRNSDR
jgi:hypothetical protein